MKHLFISVALLIVFTGSISPSPLDDMISALSKADIAQLSRHMDNTIEITLPGKSGTYSKSQAQMVLRNFFAFRNLKDLEVIHINRSEKIQYCLAILRTTSQNFRVTLLARSRGNQLLLQELRIEGK
jgi:hypothetical protein